MKLFIAPLFLLFLGGFCFAQSPSDGSGLTVVRQKWHRDVRDPALDRDVQQENAAILDDEQKRKALDQENDIRRAQGMPIRPEPTPEFKPDMSKSSHSVDYVYEVTFNNGGSKDVSSVTWEYVFFAPDSVKEVGRRRFDSKEPIRTGKTKTLTARSAVPPTGTVDAAKAGSKTPEKYNEKIIVVSVEYADGTKWTLPN